MKNFIILMLTLCIASTAAFAGAFKADARTKRIQQKDFQEVLNFILILTT